MAQKVELLDMDSNIEIASRLLRPPVIEASDDLMSIYQANHPEIDTVEVITDRPSVRVLYMSELLIGNPDAAVDFYLATVEQVGSFPEDMRPDIAVLSGLMQGDFKFLEKSRRDGLVPELSSMDAQFKHARLMIEKMQAAGVPVLYNMGDDDRRIAQEYTMEVFRKIQDYAKIQDGSKGAKMGQHPQWQSHLQFQVNAVFPYCLRAGRRLHTADEMTEQTGGKINVEEYFLLFGAAQALKTGNQVPQAHIAWLKQAKLAQIQDLIITDDVDMQVTTAGRIYTDSIRHYMGLSSQLMYQNHMTPSVEAVAHLAANGRPMPDMFITQHNQEEVGVNCQDAWVISTGGLIRARNFLHASGSRSDTKGNLARSLVTSRRRIPEPSASMHERTDDGRHTVTFMNEALNEKSFSLPDRLTIAELCDLQTGSITARPDLLAKYLDYIRTRALGERATAIFFGGDMLHGRNYAHFASESQMTGLMAMDSQETFNTQLFQECFQGITTEELQALQKVLVQPGNHEWNSGTLSSHGYSFTTAMRNLFERMYARAGFSDEEIAERVQSHEAIITPKGEYATGYTGVEYFGAIGVLIQHYLLERGSKSGGDLPVYQAHHYANGAGDLMRNVDVFMAGHWHHPQYGLFGDKLGLVGGSMAGLSDYELKRGRRPTIAGTLLHMGGGLPIQIEFVSEQALHAHTITTGGLAAEALAQQGYRDDREFDAAKHGIFMPDRFAKSALQKRLLQMMRGASQRADRIAVLR